MFSFFALLIFIRLAAFYAENINNPQIENDESWTEMLFKGFKGTIRGLFDNIGIKLEENKGKILDTIEINELLATSKSLIKDGEVIKSIENLVKIYESDPEHQETCSLLGGLLLGIEEHGLAGDLLYTAIRLSNWTDSVSVVNFAESLRHREDYDLGLKVLYRGLQALNNTDDTGILSRSIGNLLVSQKNYRQAADWFLGASLKNPTNAQDWLLASTMSFPRSAHDYVFAENVLVQAIQSIPASAVLYYHLGLVMHFTEREKEAIPLYRESLRLQEEDNPSVSSLATALHAIGDIQNAFIEYQKAVIVDPKNTIMLVNFGKLLLSHQNKQDCLKLALMAIEADPERANAEAIELERTCREST